MDGAAPDPGALLVIVLAFMVFGWKLLTWERFAMRCPQCMGKGAHKEDCPWNR